MVIINITIIITIIDNNKYDYCYDSNYNDHNNKYYYYYGDPRKSTRCLTQ